MITKAIVEEIISPYEVKVRIPTIDGAGFNSIKTTDELNIATICTLPNCYINISVGDVVFVGFEDNTMYKAVILGHLCRSDDYPTAANLLLSDLKVYDSAKLPTSTQIGDITYEQIKHLEKVSGNIQEQLNVLTSKYEKLYALVTQQET